MTSQKKSSRLWNEEDKVIEACAATILYRKRRNANVLPLPPELNDLINSNHVFRFKIMIKQLLPELKFRYEDDDESCSVNENFDELIYNPLRGGFKCRYRLCRDISFGQEVFPVEVYSDTQNCVPPEEFTYISNNDYTKFRSDRSYADDILAVTCDCSDLICGECCLCRKMNDKLTTCTIMGDGRVFLNSNATFFNTLIVGCGDKCACKAKCKNTLSGVCLPAPFKFEVFRRSDNLGFGLRTLSNIPLGCAVMEFCGEVIDQQVLVARGSDALDYAFCLQTDNELEVYEKLALTMNKGCKPFSEWNVIAYIDPKRKGNIGRFISHGCFPNLVMLRYAENDLRLHRSRAILFASQPILGGSELFFDYGNQYLSRVRFKCECGTLWCGSVKKRRSTRISFEEIVKKSFDYFAFIEKRATLLDAKAKQYLRNRGIVKPEYDDLDEAYSSNRSKNSRVDPSSVHRRNGDNTPTICYNIYCRKHSKCTCKALARITPIITID